MNNKIKSSAYDSYRQWKGWDTGCHLQPWQERYFEKELTRACPATFKAVLELGFGNGEFLLWAKKQGAEPVGVEIIPELVQAASKIGLEVYEWNIVAEVDQGSPIAGKTFDCIVAFDVIEHMDVEMAQRALQRMALYLNSGGKVILRFPNGESPFYLPLQNGDHTHRMNVTKSKLEHIAINSGLKLDGYYNSARVANVRSTAWLKWLLYRMRDLIEVTIGYGYYNKRVPLDPAATAVLSKK